MSGTGVPLERVISLFRQGLTPDAIARDMSLPSLADVYRILGYYVDHRAEVDAYVGALAEEEQREWEEIRRKHPQTDLRERLVAQLTADDPPPR